MRRRISGISDGARLKGRIALIKDDIEHGARPQLRAKDDARGVTSLDYLRIVWQDKRVPIAVRVLAASKGTKFEHEAKPISIHQTGEVTHHIKRVTLIKRECHTDPN